MAVPNPENKKPISLFFQVWWDHFWMLMGIGATYSLIRLLVIPCGLADAGLTNITRNLACGKHTFGMSDFFDTIKSNWKQSLLIGIINTFLLAFIALALWFYISSEGLIAQIAIGVMVASFLVLSFAKLYIWTIVITFSIPTGKVYKNSILMAFVNLKQNIVICLIYMVLYAIALIPVLLFPSLLTLAWGVLLAVFILPGFTSLMTQWMVFPALRRYMIDPYYQEHPDADIELRKSLGIYEDSENRTESVFQDNV